MTGLNSFTLRGESNAIRARQIAQAEHLDGQPLEAYVALAKECGCNMRKILQRVEAGEMLVE